VKEMENPIYVKMINEEEHEYDTDDMDVASLSNGN